MDIEFCDSVYEAAELSQMPEYNRGRGDTDFAILL